MSTIARPRIRVTTYHPEATDWVRRVGLVGGGVSPGTAGAVSRFCHAIDRNGMRDRFVRFNPFAGTGLVASLVPLYLARSFRGAVVGNATDTNNNFVASDYSEASGLLGNGSSKFLQTGLAVNLLTAGDRHLSAWETVRSGQTFDVFMGCESVAAGTNQFLLGYTGSATVVGFGFGAFAANLTSTTVTTGAHWLGVNAPSNTGVLYRNGAQDGTTTQASATTDSTTIAVFGNNRLGSTTDFFGGRLGSYSIGLAMTAAQASLFYNAHLSLHAALGRP